MTISTEITRTDPFIGDGTGVAFPYAFQINTDADLEVILTAVDGGETVQTLNTDYTIAGAGTPNGTVTMTVAPATGEVLTIRRKMALLQETDLQNQGAFFAETHEDVFDRLTMHDQQISEELGRTLRLPLSDGGTITLPSASARKGKYLFGNAVTGDIEFVGSAPITLINVTDFGAAGNGVTDDTANIQAAIDAAEATGDGTRVFFPRTSGGTYLISAQLLISKGIFLEFEGMGDNGNKATPNDGKTQILWKTGSGAGTMVRFVEPTLGERLFGGGILGSVRIDCNDEAAIGIRGSSLQGTYFDDLYIARAVGTAMILDNGNDDLFNNVRIDNLYVLHGGDPAVINADGLTIDGDLHSDAGTSCYIGNLTVEYQNGNGLTIRGVDTCYFGRVKTIPRNGHVNHGGTDTGYGVVFAKAVLNSFQAAKNFIAHLGRGTVYVEDNTIGNKIGFMNGEGGSVEFENGATPGTLSYQVVDHIHGDYFETPVWALSDNLSVSLGGFFPFTGDPALAAVGSTLGVAVAFGAATTEKAVWSLAPPQNWNNGEIIGIRVQFAQYGSAAGDVVWLVDASTRAVGVGPGSSEATKQETVTVPGIAATLHSQEFIFAPPLPYTRGDVVYFGVSRLGTDVADTYVNDCGVVGVQLLYQSNGPDVNVNTGPWEIPVTHID